MSRASVAELILQPFRHFTYVTAHSPTLPSLYLLHSSFSNTFVASPSSQLIPQPSFRFSYVTGSSLMSSDEPPMVCSDLSVNIHNALYFLKSPSRATENSLAGRRRPGGRGLKTPDLECGRPLFLLPRGLPSNARLGSLPSSIL